jgi:EAL domain-containing protein (putative c-di-GMP-specific phosphodiesterase class I)
MRVAVDDTGSGYASLSHVLRMRPELIKLDRELTGGIAEDPARQALAAALVRFASALDASVIAEGVETEAEARTVAELGVNRAQGVVPRSARTAGRARPRDAMAPRPLNPAPGPRTPTRPPGV